MSTPFIGEIKIVGFNFAPRGCAFCNGQLLPISQNTALFSILGTTYGGDGKTTFALPDLRDAAPMDAGNGPGLTPRTLGEKMGSATVTLLDIEIPSHTHSLNGALIIPPNAEQNTSAPGATAVLGPSNPGKAYSDTTTPPVMMAPQTIGTEGGTIPHENRHPILAVNFVIALQGVFPARN
jgi:microcystin-dependent protein